MAAVQSRSVAIKRSFGIEEPAEVKAMLEGKRMIGIDKDGVFLDISELIFENRRRGFANVLDPEDGIVCNFTPETMYRLAGINDDYNSGTRPILALIAVNRYTKDAFPSNGTSPEQVLRDIVYGTNAADVLDGLISRYIRKSDHAVAQEVYFWDKGAFFSSKEGGEYNRPLPGAKEAVMELNRMYNGRVPIITNTPTRDIAARDMRISGFSSSEIGRMVVITREDVSAAKPDPELLNRAMEIFSVSPKESAYVGDSVGDVKTAKNAGITSIAVLSGMASRMHLEAARPDIIVDDLQSLVGMLRD